MAESDRSILTVLADIVADVQQIIRAEFRLAKVELSEELAKVRRRAMLAAAGIVLVILSLGVLALSAVWAVALVLPPWAAALVVGAALALIGGIIAMAGIKRMTDVHLPPEKTVETIKENIQWAKTRVR
jgi:uncharacterized membrane protein YqjE